MLFWDKLKVFNRKKGTNNTDSEDSEFRDYLTRILGFSPENLQVYKEAFIHRSAQVKDENGNDINFERLEFLGDAVLGLIIAVFIFQEAPDKQEGYLTKMRSKIVSRNQLNEIGKQLKLQQRLQPAANPNLGEDINGDLVEALIGAVYLDQGYNSTAQFIFKKIVENHVDLDRLEKTIASHKSLILEWGQKTKNRINFNTFEEENAEDLTVFVSVVRMNDKVIAKGRGTSKKRAEENASKRAFYFLQNKMENVL
ncbi:ribonuclease III [Moheibacter sediminis]|uniref:Ribonuclease 3 n=1 Tax=Moheibacter sediminis TaxID=1434700 RepID=A0A1W1YMN0_9FLAO|nr:ribonuclease III [Moheibacter sediminis]SMC36968.1 RNAse III [Moheibacter sediminis]